MEGSNMPWIGVKDDNQGKEQNQVLH